MNHHLRAALQVPRRSFRSSASDMKLTSSHRRGSSTSHLHISRELGDQGLWVTSITFGARTGTTGLYQYSNEKQHKSFPIGSVHLSMSLIVMPWCHEAKGACSNTFLG
jgi:hypothetical protein